MRQKIYDYWNNRTPYTWGSYADMRRLRYGLQDYMHDVFCFTGWSGKKVLEIGCGAGIDSIEYARNGAIVYATDMTDNALKNTKRMIRASPYLRSKMKIRTKKVDACKLPYKDGFFDLVYSYGVLHHIPDAEKAVEEIWRVLKPYGWCYAMLYHEESMLYYGSILYNAGILKEGFKQGLTEEQLLCKYSEAKEGCPYTKAYTVDEAKNLFGWGWKLENDGSITTIKTFQSEVTIEYPVIDTLFERKVKIPNLPKHLGWHLIIKAQKL